MINKELHKLYKDEVEIEFYSDSHRYKKLGEKTYLISATAITGIIDKSRFLIPWAVGLCGNFIKIFFETSSRNSYTSEELLPVIDEALIQHTVKKEEAAGIGTQVHNWVHEFTKAKIGNLKNPAFPENEKVLNGINGFLDWYNGNEIKFLETEKLVYSKEHDFVGITDAIVEINGKKILLDYKTSKGIYNEHYYQVAGYRLAYEEENGKIDGVMILHFDKENGGVKVIEVSEENYQKNIPVFLACLTIKRREKELSNY